MKQFYLTTPIYYVNAAPHIGHTYTTIAAEVIARLKRAEGYEVVLATGTDEHGQKIERAAKAVNQSPQAFTDVVSGEFTKQWAELGLQIDRFKRTTDPAHHRKVQELFLRCQERGFVYKSSYTGAYCVSDELYANENKPGEPCPICGRILEEVTEENYFFKLSAFQDRLLKLYEEQPDFIQPEIRRNEVLAFVRGGLQDLSISRTSITWGIPVPNEEKHVFYVWFDALTTYVSAVDGEGRWPADLHLIGKEILRFHAVFWPAFLMAADWPLPKQIFAHGWLLFENDKMSKTKGNLLRATPITTVVGVDALRYFLLREVVFGSDGNFSLDALVARYNADLANGLGNLTSRTLTMIKQYRAGLVPTVPVLESVAAQIAATTQQAQAHYAKFEFSKALETIWALIGFLDRLIMEEKPWELAKRSEHERLDTVLCSTYRALEAICNLAHPVIPASIDKIRAQMGADGQVGDLTPVFPRLDAKLVIPQMQELEQAELARQNALLGKVAAPEADVSAVSPLSPEITIDDFVKVDLRVGLVISAEAVKGADKLLHLKVDIGEAEPRTIVAGIAKAYAPETLVNRKVVIVANLAPRKLRGIESKGMIVAASLEGGPPVLAAFLEEVPVGARLK
ncbi:MAG: methionine--tRNA ligase [Bryobacteraceae bacterium]|nr:methionine--tRNA ligase [Bryobacteraceae bacterium]